MKSRIILPLECRGLDRVWESSQNVEYYVEKVEDYAGKLEKALEAAEEELMDNQGVKSMFKELMTNIRIAARFIEHDNLKGDEWLDKLFDTLKQVYYLNSINK